MSLALRSFPLPHFLKFLSLCAPFDIGFPLKKNRNDASDVVFKKIIILFLSQPQIGKFAIIKGWGGESGETERTRNLNWICVRGGRGRCEEIVHVPPSGWVRGMERGCPVFREFTPPPRDWELLPKLLQ